MVTRGNDEKTIRILHVDDEPDFAEMATAFLEREDNRFETETATSASDGLTRLADSQFDCIISDYDMPRQDGIEFLRAVRKKQPNLPFILFTGKGSEAVAGDAIRAGVTDYLQKSSGTEQYELLAHQIRNAVEQLQVEQRVQKEQQRFRTLFDRLSQPTVEVQFEAGEPIINKVNAAFEDVFGYNSDTLVGDSLDTHIVPDDRIDEAKAINQRVQAGERLKSKEVTRETASGFRTFFLQSAVYDDGSGGFGIYTDITDRRDCEETLERNRSLLQHTEQLANVGGWEADVETGEQRWTHGTYAIHDLDSAGESEPSIETGINFYHPDDQEMIKQAFEKCRTHGEAYELNVRLITAEDEQKWVRTTGEPVYNEDGDDVSKIRGAICNITNIRAQEQELKELKQQYQTLAENFPDGAVYLIDDNFEYVRARGEALEQADLSSADIEGHTPHDVFSDESANEICKHYEEAFNGNTITTEGEYKGEQYRTRVTPVDCDGTEITRVMAVAQNITEYAKDKRELRRQNERLDKFVSVVSHDLRNPLSVAEGNLQLLRGECDSERIGKIESALSRMDDLIEDLLQTARTGDKVDNIKPVNLANLSQDCWRNVETSNATISLNIDGNIRADRSRLAQLFENLMRNAIEHTNQEVTITVGELRDGFYIEDDGTGIPEDKRDNIFEAGYTTTEEGTGFGLSIVKQVVNAHGWDISIAEGSEGGARFEITSVDFETEQVRE